MTKYNCGTRKEDYMNVFPMDNYIQFHIEYNDVQRVDGKRLNLSMEDTKDLIVYLQSIVDEEEKKNAKMLSGLKTSSLVEELKKRKNVYSTNSDYYITTKVEAKEPSTILIIPDKC